MADSQNHADPTEASGLWAPAEGQRVSGSQNVQIVNAVGSDITVIYEGRPQSLPLDSAVVVPSAATRSPARLLRARSGVIPFAARQGMLRHLEGWCSSSAPFAARITAGAGGTGKTRTGVALCEFLSRERGWLAGLLRQDADRGSIEALARTPATRLIVVDYAEHRLEQLSLLLPLLRLHASEENPVRVQLLVRSPPRRTGVWTEALSHYSDELDALLDDMETDVLSDVPLTEPERRELFVSAQQALSQWVERAEPEISSPPEQLAAATFGSPLLVVIAAYLALHDERRVPTSREELLADLLAHEDRHWRQSAAAIVRDGTLRRRVVALATLAGAWSEGEAVQLLRLIPELADSSNERRTELARWAHRLYDGDRWWNPLEPDLIGEHLVVTTYSDQPEILAGVLGDRPAASLIQPLVTYARAGSNYEQFAATIAPIISDQLEHLCQLAADEVANESHVEVFAGPTTLAAVLSQVLEQYRVDPNLLPDILNALPRQPNLGLRSLQLNLTIQLAADRWRLARRDPAFIPFLPGTLNNLSVQLGAWGWLKEALTFSQRAVELFRMLADTDPEEHLAGLANALSTHAGALAAQGRYEEALAATMDALAVDRRMVEIAPAEALPGLIASLNNVSQDLAALGRRREAVLASKDAVGLIGRLSKAAQELHQEALLSALMTFSVRLGEVGRSDLALNAGLNVVVGYQRLAEDDPAAHLPALAKSLDNLSLTLAAMGQLDDALNASRQAVGHYRRLVAVEAETYRPDLARSLNNLTGRLCELGQNVEGLAAIEESVSIRRQLAACNAAVHLPGLGSSLHSYSLCLWDLGRRSESLKAVEEAITVRASLAATNPPAHLPDLIKSQRLLGARLAALANGRRGELSGVEAEAED